MSPSQRLTVDTAVNDSLNSIPPLHSAVISVPANWGLDSPSPLDSSPMEPSPDPTVEASSRGRELEPPLPLSASSSSSSSNPIFGWPPSSSVPKVTVLKNHTDPFDNMRSFSDDPFGHRSSSSSSGDEYDQLRPSEGAVHDQRSVLMIPEPIDQSAIAMDHIPIFNRTFSSPLPNRVGSLGHPLSHRPHLRATHFDPWRSLSLELADSLQAAIQTLLHVSPPHLLDNAKEQYAGCAIQLPTTSVSALLTSMRGLNYLSANLVPLYEGHPGGIRIVDDFDLGELVQNVADQLSGLAAQAEVDLVLFHGDVGMKHVSVSGDREGIGYVLGHVLRQILLVVNKGDTIELGLQIIPQSPSMTPRVSLPLATTELEERQSLQHSSNVRSSSPGKTLPSPPSGLVDGPLMCILEIVHNTYQAQDLNAATPKAELNPFTRLAEEKEAATPKFDTPLCHRLLRHVNASLRTNIQPSSPTGFGSTRNGYELSVLLSRGRPIPEPAPLSAEEEANRQPFTGVQLPREPTLSELANFAESLRGRKVSLHASLMSVFARHLTSYLAAWGLDVSHIPIEDDAPPMIDPAGTPKFILIDDDVSVLRRELHRLKTESSPLTIRQRSLKRPNLFPRTKSTYAIRQSPSVVIHFTSLDKYHQVRDAITNLGSFVHPEVIVVPKPVGPRRFLTALFTAVHQPFVDPVFSPIASSPRSPTSNYLPSNNRTPTGNELSGFFETIEPVHVEPTPPKRSPLNEHPPPSVGPVVRTGDGLHLSLPTPGDYVTTPASEYFSSATSGKASSGASGVVMQSPDGRPFGMFFEPPASGRRTSYSQRSDSLRRKPASRRTSATTEPVTTSTSSPNNSPQSSRRASALSSVSAATDESTGGDSTNLLPQSSRRKTLPPAPDSKPILAQGRDRSSNTSHHPIAVTEIDPQIGDKPLPEISETKRTAAKSSDVVVPPINVLIVEDNPINQNILSMFFRKKKIKHQTAKDGLEAVEKWRTGGFHLILMDIQLPVMDGIEATKEIRKLERNSNIGVFPSTPVSEHPKLAEIPVSSPFRSAVIIVALTASSLQTDRVAALGAGCNDFLTKPVSLKWLEKKTVEWGCMQALIDFDGWRRWKGSDPRDPSETKRGFQVGPQAAARSLASRLRIDRSKGRPTPPSIAEQPTPTASSEDVTENGATSNNKLETKQDMPNPQTNDKPLPALPAEP